MNDTNISEELKKINAKLDRIEKISKRTQSQFMWFIILTLASVALPAVGLIFFIPKFISLYTDMMQ